MFMYSMCMHWLYFLLIWSDMGVSFTSQNTSTWFACFSGFSWEQIFGSARKCGQSTPADSVPRSAKSVKVWTFFTSKTHQKQAGLSLHIWKMWFIIGICVCVFYSIAIPCMVYWTTYAINKPSTIRVAKSASPMDGMGFFEVSIGMKARELVGEFRRLKNHGNFPKCQIRQAMLGLWLGQPEIRPY